jgi:hypothetical protein
MMKWPRVKRGAGTLRGMLSWSIVGDCSTRNYSFKPFKPFKPFKTFNPFGNLGRFFRLTV